MMYKIKIGFCGKFQKKSPFFCIFHITEKSCFTENFGRNPVRCIARKIVSEQRISNIIILSFPIFRLCNNIPILKCSLRHNPHLWIFFNFLSHFCERIFCQKIVIIQKNNIILKIRICILYNPIERTISRKIRSLIRVVFEKFLARIFAN